MEKKYSVSRLEFNRDHEGNIVSIFLAVSVLDGENSAYQEYWLNETDKNLVLENQDNLKDIITKCYVEAELKMENEIATRPMPSIYPLQEEGKKEEIEMMVKVADVATKKTAIVAERAVAEEARLQAIEDSKPVEVLPEEPILDETK